MSSMAASSASLQSSALFSDSLNGVGGYGYLLEPLWWEGMIIMILSEIASFVAYIFAPAVLVTPLGALSIIVSAILAHFILKEKLQRMGVLGCVLCIVGSTVIVLHAPEEKTPTSVQEIWNLATQPAFLLYAASAVAISLVLMLHFSPRDGQTNIMVYLGICSVIGSLDSNEHQGSGHCDQAHDRGHQPGGVFPDVGFLHDRRHLHHHPTELFEHGTRHIRYIGRLARMLRHVHCNSPTGSFHVMIIILFCKI